MRQHAMKPYARVGLVALAFLLAGTIALAVAAVAESDPRQRISQLDETVVPNLALVTDIRSTLSEGQTAFNLATFATIDERAAQITTVAGASDMVNDQLDEIDRRPTAFTGEDELRSELRESYDASVELATTAGLLIVSEPNFADPVTIEALHDTAASFAATDAIAERYQQEYTNLTQSELDEVTAASSRTRVLGFGLGSALFGSATVFAFIMFRSARKQHREVERVAADRLVEIERNEFETRLQRALDLVDNEDDVYPVVSEALSTATEGQFAEVLLADSSRAHFRRVIATISDHAVGCHVSAPDECPAARRGQPIVFTSSNTLDACRHLRDRPEGACSALCNPVRIAGGTLGVVHVTGPENDPPDHTTTGLIDLVTRKTAERIGMLRAFSQAETQARTDALTGLLNRRSLETEVKRLVDDGSSYVVAYGDLDLFKHLNDVHGHAAGDRALRVVARALRDSVRPSDIVARYGGEEFLIVLPNCDPPLASVVVDRVRDRFRHYLEAAAAPNVTISFGIAAGEHLGEFEEVVARADEALLRAKAAGRNRVIVSGDEPPPPTTPIGELRAI